MKIYKMAQDFSGGGGKTILKLVTVKSTGEFKATIIGHANGAKCSDGFDEDILRDLLNAEVVGFGNVMAETDSGHTPEYFEEKKKTKVNPVVSKPIDEEDDDLTTPSSGKKLDLGYGV
jgi:hypothetical protein